MVSMSWRQYGDSDTTRRQILGHWSWLTRTEWRESGYYRQIYRLQFDSDVVTARALARAALAILEALPIENGSVTVDHFSINRSDGWSGDHKITVERRR